MNATSIRSPSVTHEYFRRVDWNAAWTWLLGFGLIAYLGLEGGGYDPLVHDQVGIVVWWVLVVGALVGALPRFSPGALAWAALSLLAGFAIWTALSLSWTESSEQTATELALVTTYVGVLGLAIFGHDRANPQRLVGAVAAGIVLVALAGLLSRLHPAWFSEASQTARFLEDSERLSYPLNYWNATAALVAIGLPLLLQIATCARTVLARALAAAALPAMFLTIFFTLSRGGIATAIIVLAVFLGLTSDRLPKLLTLLVSGAGGAILISATTHRDALQEGLSSSTAYQQGDDVLLIALAVCLLAGLITAAISHGLSGERRPRWTRVSRGNALVATGIAAAVVLVAMAAFDVPRRASDGWDEFKDGGGPGSGTGRLGSVAGQNRYQFWSAAVRESSTDPLRGTGSGTFEFWWARDGDSAETVRDAHSLYMQTLGELGVVGLALLAGFLLAILVGGARNAILADPRGRALLAAALAGCTAFCLTATVDWMWQIPVLPVSALLLGSTLLTAGAQRETEERHALPQMTLRLGIAAAGLAAIVAIAIPLASTSLLRQSETEARAGDLNAALEAARSAQNVESGFAGPWLQEALVLEQLGDFPAATSAAREATAREPTNWRNWLILSRLEAAWGRAAASVRAYRKAKSLNPNFSLFAR